ncbi:MAG TPA: glycosyltransferase family 4 protein [Bryobacteraceae bacterium]|nr:glycosyltransferase family 4 protein [Bryobacteraceae bacterium]
MKVLCLDQFSEFGGAQLCLRDVLCEMRERGWDATVMAPGEGPLLEFAESLGFETARLPLSRYTNGRKSTRDLLAFPGDMLRCGCMVRHRGQFDLIYVNGPRVLPVVAGMAVPVLFHSHSLLDKRYARIAVHRSLGQYGAVVSCSEFTAGYLRARAGLRVKVIYNGVPDCGSARRRDTGTGCLRVGILARISPEKGHLAFIGAARVLPDRNRMRFIAIGAALFSDPAYERSVYAAGAQEGVEFRGWADDPAKVLQELDVLAVPSAACEASPRVIMEALSAGTVVVAYPSGGIPELIRNGHDGLLTDDCSSQALAKSIKILADNPELRNRLAENGRNTFQSRFTVKRFRREVCDEMQVPSASAGRSG